jgi:hypothetical protein
MDRGTLCEPWQTVARAFCMWRENAMALQRERVVTFLDREEVDFLDKVGKDALFSTGLKLSRAKLISWIIDFAKSLAINGENLKSEADLNKQLKEILKENIENNKKE